MRTREGRKKYHIALEINNSSPVKKKYRLNCYENYKIMLNLCQQYQVPIIVSSDAHDPGWVGNFELACGLLQEINIDDELILNNNIEKLKKFIGML